MKNYAVMEGGVAAVLTNLENTKLKEARKYHVLQTWTVKSGLVHREGIQEQEGFWPNQNKTKAKTGSVYVGL